MKRLKTPREEGQRLTFYTHLAEASVDFETFRMHVERRTRMLRQIEEGGQNARHLSTGVEEDVLSHFLCRLVCSQMPWTASWFVNVETALFRLRVSRSLIDTRDFFMNEVLPHMDSPETEGHSLVLGVRSRYNPDVFNDSSFSDVSVHFTKLIDLVGKRVVTPVRGHVRLDDDCIKSLLVNEFRRHLSSRMDTLVEMSQNHPDERMMGLCNELFMSTARTERVPSFLLEQSQRHFPPCMQMIMERLRRNGHLKYNDRQILCRFLKDCGMEVGDATLFFRNSFRVSREVFDKEYLYSIRHNYGLEGKRANYSSFNCSRIASTMNERRESSCPFVGNASQVRNYVGDADVDIEDVLSGNSFNGKCTRLLEELTHRRQDKLVATPVRYYLEHSRGSGDGKENRCG